MFFENTKQSKYTKHNEINLALLYFFVGELT
jgi:hypothetical protein